MSEGKLSFTRISCRNLPIGEWLPAFFGLSLEGRWVKSRLFLLFAATQEFFPRIQSYDISVVAMIFNSLPFTKFSYFAYSFHFEIGVPGSQLQ